MNKRKLLQKALADGRNLHFRDLVVLVEAFGFELARVSGSHHIFEHPGIPELVNLQNRKGKAKQYQVKQFQLVEEYNQSMRE